MTNSLKRLKPLEISNLNMISLAPPVKDFDQVRAQTDGILLSPIKMLREQKGLSQKQLANRIGMERTRLVRLEQKNWGEMSVGDLELISNALGFRVSELLNRFSGFGREGIANRTLLAVPHFKVDSGKGYRFGSVLEKPECCFVGTLHIEPQKGVPHAETPKASFIFYLVLEGDLLLTMGCKEYRLREKESFTVNASSSYEFYNPHQFKEASLLIFSLPSFIKSS